MKFDLARFQRVLARLGHPEKRFRAVHVAGTNGKGSVSALVQASLSSAGYRCGLYTSPHLVRWNERVRIGSSVISDRQADRLAVVIERRLRAGGVPVSGLTQFEFFTALAFLWFAEKRVDVAVIETGLGGRLDATNTLGEVSLTIITSIGMDHMRWLGRTRAAIAREKAGIIRPGVSVVTGAAGVALRTIRTAARAQRAPVSVVSTDTAYAGRLGLRGTFQRRNAAVAYRALSLLRPAFPRLTERVVRRAFATACWPGRFDWRKARSRKGDRLIMLDAAHNVDGVRALRDALAAAGWARFDLLFGVAGDKDVNGIVRVLAPAVRRAVVVAIPSERTANPDVVAALKPWKGRAVAAPSVSEGWRAIQSEGDRTPVVVAGSIYLVGAVLARYGRTLVSVGN